MTFEHCGFAREIRAITRLCRWMRLSCGFRAANRGCIGNFDLREEAVAAASNGFHKAGTLGGVAEGLTDFADRFVEPVVEIHESVRGPEFFLKLLASYDLAGVLEQHRQELERLLLKANPQTVFTQFAGTKIQFENPKSETPVEVKAFLHGRMNALRNLVYHLAEFA